MTWTRIAVVGAGAIGRSHIAVIEALPEAELAAIVDPSPSARGIAGAGVPVFDAIEAMLQTVRPDGVVLATPNQLHVPGALACLAAGVPVLVEKPLADGLEEGRRLVEAQARAGVPVLVGHYRRHNPILRKAREIVRSGQLGRITCVVATCLVLKPDDYFEVSWRVQPGGGPVLINLVHDIDNLRFICGDIVAVQAVASNVARRHPVEDSAAAAVLFADGAVGTFCVSDAAAGPYSWELSAGENRLYPRQFESCYLVSGTEGTLSLPMLEVWSYPRGRGWSAPLAREIAPVTPADPLVEQMRHFLRVIRGEEAPLVDAADGLRTLETVLAVGRSAQAGARVALAPAA
ncbi:Gfo/Idh/MocA family oxidoreductase [Chelatococcus sp. SYSU_G07232]|uniref:Gfo/Idh/MocA family oxidoreductase n=1 Tax=Chelatococcus albus TaxID=3047466 RepID=A0ABT7AGC7_9HYPH|nr:Gfo/Idh/MocA family oxidoreductase [Chelatococcus sp. SYSU_G07232]MDJ1158062.1 Gfo/Idh/MocA family oxidoreductase [Chelatococcus sp. SYSU_G07232]